MDDRLIEIKQDTPGFNPFFGTWVCQDDLTLLVDVGPSNSADRLIRSLSQLPLKRLDYILLTHIHIDHAGALAQVLKQYPTARVVCHAGAIQHVVDPTRLWHGSLEVLGDVARAYGPPMPVPLEKLIPHTEIDLKDLEVIETPGHALHHLSYVYKGRLYAGEAAGNYLKFEGFDYLRPATPPRFFLDVCLKSLDVLSALKDQPIRYAHFGDAASSHEMLDRIRDQLLLWAAVIGESVRQGGSTEEMIRRSLDLLLDTDRNLAAFRNMDPDVQARERIFMTNGVMGFVEYFKTDVPIDAS